MYQSDHVLRIVGRNQLCAPLLIHPEDYKAMMSRQQELLDAFAGTFHQ